MKSAKYQMSVPVIPAHTLLSVRLPVLPCAESIWRYVLQSFLHAWLRQPSPDNLLPWGKRKKLPCRCA